MKKGTMLVDMLCDFNMETLLDTPKWSMVCLHLLCCHWTCV